MQYGRPRRHPLIQELDHVQLIPKDTNGKPQLSGLKLFDHACRYRTTHATADTKNGTQTRLAPMKGMGAAIYEDSLECLQPTEAELCRGAATRDNCRDRAARTCAKRKLTALGTVAGHRGVGNSKDTMEQASKQLAFAAFQAEVKPTQGGGHDIEKVSRKSAGLYT